MKVVVFGTGGFAEVVHFYLTNDSDHEVVAFTAHDDRIESRELLGLPIVPYSEAKRAFPPADFAMFVAVGYKDLNQVRARVYQEVKADGYQLITYVSSRCTNWARSIGDNCFIFEDNTIQPFSDIGNDVILWSGNHVGHHASIGDHCFITSHVVISGYVKIGRFCFIGINSSIRDNVTVGNSNLIGAGSLIMKSTGDHDLFIAAPTKPHARKSFEVPL